MQTQIKKPSGETAQYNTRPNYTTNTLDLILSQLYKVRQTSPGQYTSCCPAHEDKNPSLMIRDDNGKILLRCLAGCDLYDILSALGISAADLFPKDPNYHSSPIKPPLRCIQNEAELIQKHAAAAKKAKHIWCQSKPITRPLEHAYLEKKHIQPHRVRLYRGLLVIPIYNDLGQLVNLQFINSQGDKRFLTGGRKQGCFNSIGALTKRILLCEGYATGASLYEESKQRVIVAFDAGNLLPVAKNIRKLSPDTEIIICGDNDNVGQAKAREAALAIGGKVLFPEIAGMDWNDVLGGQHG
jgi:DNA primase